MEPLIKAVETEVGFTGMYIFVKDNGEQSSSTAAAGFYLPMLRSLSGWSPEKKIPYKLKIKPLTEVHSKTHQKYDC